MKCKATVKLVDNTGKILLQGSGKFPKEGEIVTLSWGKVRSLDQNSLYWKYLEWIMEYGNLKNEGWMSKDELHEAFKNRLLVKRITTRAGFKTIQVGSTADLDAIAFMNYIENVDKIVCEYFSIDTSVFWREYHSMYAKGND
uniref:Uncharacterized protein n=1 Tax=viral metagenome TaxID=1070528 RepID=A0A6M3KPG5_9ZZZZ